MRRRSACLVRRSRPKAAAGSVMSGGKTTRRRKSQGRRRSFQVPEQSLSPGSVIMTLASSLIPDPTGTSTVTKLAWGNYNDRKKVSEGSAEQEIGRTHPWYGGASWLQFDFCAGVSSRPNSAPQRCHAPKFRVWRRPASSRPMRARSSSGSSTPKSLSRARLRDCGAFRYGNSRRDDLPCGPPR
jgi:hypothetical protein